MFVAVKKICGKYFMFFHDSSEKELEKEVYGSALSKYSDSDLLMKDYINSFHFYEADQSLENEVNRVESRHYQPVKIINGKAVLYLGDDAPPSTMEEIRVVYGIKKINPDICDWIFEIRGIEEGKRPGVQQFKGIYVLPFEPLWWEYYYIIGRGRTRYLTYGYKVLLQDDTPEWAEKMVKILPQKIR